MTTDSVKRSGTGNARRRRNRVLLRWAVSLAAGVAAAWLALLSLDGLAAVIAAWAAFALVNTVWLLLHVWPMDAEQTRSHATEEDPSRRVAHIVSVCGSLISLLATGAVAVRSQHTSGPEAYWLAGLAVLCVLGSWALIQTDYLLHYAHVYFSPDESGEPLGGISFNVESQPSYVDFVYFSVGLGMTYQVADTDVSRTDIRRIVIAQTLLAYLFGVGIIATVINLVSGLA
ncbi:MAG: DUF1345 domain-containing protein [Leucobacter sp.]